MRSPKTPVVQAGIVICLLVAGLASAGSTDATEPLQDAAPEPAVGALVPEATGARAASTGVPDPAAVVPDVRQPTGACGPGIGCDAAADYPGVVDEMGDTLDGHLVFGPMTHGDLMAASSVGGINVGDPDTGLWSNVRMTGGASVVFGEDPALVDIMDGGAVGNPSFMNAERAVLRMPVAITDTLTVASGGQIVIKTGADLVVDNIDDELPIEGHVVPATDATYALGSGVNRWTDLYLDSIIHHKGPLYFHGSPLDGDGGAETVTLTVDEGGNVTLPGTLTATSVVGAPEYFAGDGVSRSGYTFSLIQTCAVSEILRYSGTSWLCGTDQDTTYTAGSGLTLSGTQFGYDASVIQSRVTGTCPADTGIRAVAADGSVTCETDDDTTYTAGGGLTLAGTQFAVDTTTIQSRVTGTCPVGSSIRTIAADGSTTCEADTDTDTTYTAGSGLALTGTEFAADTTVVQVRVTGTCPVGSSIRTIAADGSTTCEADTDTTYTGGHGINVTGTTVEADASVLQNRVTGECASGSSIRAIDGSGAVTCQTDGDSGGDITAVFTGSSLAGGGASGTVNLSIANGGVQVNHLAAAATPAVGQVALSGLINTSATSTLDEFTITAPGAGYVVVTVAAQVWLDCDSDDADGIVCDNAGLALCDAGATFAPSSCENTATDLFVADADNASAVNDRHEITLTRTFPVSAGFNTFYVNGASHDNGMALHLAQGSSATAVYAPAMLTMFSGGPPT